MPVVSGAAVAAAAVGSAVELDEVERPHHDIREMNLHVMRHEMHKTDCPMIKAQLKEAIEKETADRDRTDRQFGEVWWLIHHDREIVEEEKPHHTHFPCIKAAVEVFQDRCDVHASFGLKYVHPVAHLCKKGHEFEEIAGAVMKVCRDPEAERREMARHMDVQELEIAVLAKRHEEAECPVLRAQLKDAIEKEVAARDRVTRRFFKVVRELVGEDTSILETEVKKPQYTCVHAALQDFEDTCGVPAAHGLRYFQGFSALCHHGHTFEKIHVATHKICRHHE